MCRLQMFWSVRRREKKKKVFMLAMYGLMRSVKGVGGGDKEMNGER